MKRLADASQGVQLATIQKLARLLGEQITTGVGARRHCKALPHFITEIDGLDIHFIHVRSKHENALPLIVTHGWPGSIIEQLKIIDPLTNPTAHGASESDAFHLVIPSMPGYGFSGKPTTSGWGPARIAQAWDVLMKRLGYTRYRGPGRRLGRAHRRSDGCTGACGIAWHSHEHGWRSSPGHRQGSVYRGCCTLPGSRQTRSTRLTSSAFSTSTVSDTRRKWGTAHRRCMGSQIHL